MERLNPRLRGKNRDNQILRAVETYKSLDTQQVYQLFHFYQISGGLRKCQERLLKLHRKGKLGREKLGEASYAYWVEKPPNLAHLIATNWVRIHIENNLSSWEKLHCWTYEKPSYEKLLRPDAFIAVKNSITGKFRFQFIEADLATNPMDKIEKYNKLFESDKWLSDWWVKLSARFPPVLIVTVRPDIVRRMIEGQNHAGIEFVVRHFEDILREAKQIDNHLQEGERRVGQGKQG